MMKPLPHIFFTLRSSFFVLFFSLFTLCSFAQQPEYPDSGFTNKAEAKNLTINGKKEGKWVEYYRVYDNLRYSGLKITKRHTRNYHLLVYKQGKPYGIERQMEDEKLLVITPYKNGMKNGTVIVYFDNGVIWQEKHYKNDSLDGISRMYYRTGDIDLDEAYYSIGRLDSVRSFDRNGTLRERRIYLDPLHCMRMVYDKNGMYLYKADDRYKKDLEYDERLYYPNGILKSEASYSSEFNLTGPKKDYYEDGKLKTLTIYKRNRIISVKNYDENGNQIKQ